MDNGVGSFEKEIHRLLMVKLEVQELFVPFRHMQVAKIHYISTTFS